MTNHEPNCLAAAMIAAVENLRDAELEGLNWRLTDPNQDVRVIAHDLLEDGTMTCRCSDQRVWINVYEVDRVYGGPEEGGWWYTTYTPEVSIVMVENGPEANLSFSSVCEMSELIARLEAEYPSSGASGSVMYRGGDYRILVETSEGQYSPVVPPAYC